MHRYFLLFLLILPLPNLSQENITVQLQVPPGRGVPLDESFMAIITNSGEPAEVFLRGTVQQEKDDKLQGEGNTYYFEERIYDPRRGR